MLWRVKRFCWEKGFVGVLGVGLGMRVLGFFGVDGWLGVFWEGVKFAGEGLENGCFGK